MLIDPPYEEAGDFARLCQRALGEAHRKWPTGIYMLWYPIKERDAPDALARRLRRLGVPKVAALRNDAAPAAPDGGLAGSGLIVVNPPIAACGARLRNSAAGAWRVLSPTRRPSPARLAGRQRRGQ